MKKYFIFAVLAMVFYSCEEPIKNDKNVKKIETVDVGTQTDDNSDKEETKDQGTDPMVFVSDIEVSSQEIFVNPQETATLDVKVLPENADNTEYTIVSEDETVATVDDNGTITAVSTTGGVTKIKISSKDGAVEKIVNVYVITPMPEYDVDLQKDSTELKKWRDEGIPENGVVVLGPKIKKIQKVAFTNSEKLKKIVFSSNLEEIGSRAFDGCSLLTEVEVPANVKVFTSAFAHCKSLKKIVFGDGCTFSSSTGYKYKEILKGCTMLQEVVLPSDLDFIPESMFSLCTSLKEIKLPASVSSIEPKAFEQTTSLKSIKLEEGNESYKVVDDVLYSKDGEMLILYPAMKDGEEYQVSDGVKRISDFAFYGCSNLKKVSLPTSVERMGPNTFYNRFDKSSLKEITINSSSVPEVKGDGKYDGPTNIDYKGKVLVDAALITAFKESVGFNHPDIIIDAKL